MPAYRNMLTGRPSRVAGPSIWLCVFWLAAAPVQSRAAPKPAAPPQPVAYLLGVELASLPSTLGTFPGSAVRTFQPPPSEGVAAQRATIHWQSSPRAPLRNGVLLFEYAHERHPRIFNRALPIAGSSRAGVRTPVDVPADDVRRWGPVAKWRATIAWKGRVLARKESPNWRTSP
jgi:hypothetical protein